MRWLCEKYGVVKKVIADVGIRSAVCKEIVSNYFEHDFCLDFVVITTIF